MTHEPRMRTWDWRLFTWLSLLWRNWRWQKATCSRNTDSYLCLWCMKTYSRSHPWHPLLQWCSAPELKARWWWTRRGRRSEVSTKFRETKLIMQITFNKEHKAVEDTEIATSNPSHIKDSLLWWWVYLMVQIVVRQYQGGKKEATVHWFVWVVLK